jgi:hypothetical protein
MYFTNKYVRASTYLLSGTVDNDNQMTTFVYA